MKSLKQAKLDEKQQMLQSRQEAKGPAKHTGDKPVAQGTQPTVKFE